MELIEHLIRSVDSKDEAAREVIVGPLWTLVVSRGYGIASNMGSKAPDRAETTGDLSRKTVGDLLGLALSENTFEASIGIAALNSLIAGDIDRKRFRPYSIPRARDKVIALAGDFAFTQDLRQMAREVLIIEKPTGPGKTLADETHRLISEADIAIIAGSSIIDHTLEPLLRACSHCFTIIHGPSTPLSPVLFEHGADQLVGIAVEDEASVKAWVVEGKDDISKCPGLHPTVLMRSQAQQSR
jgi:hypothetical protein